MPRPNDLTRRDALRTLTAGGVAGLGAAALNPRAAVAEPATRNRALRVAHMTDPHIDSREGSDRALAACYNHIQSAGAELILNTGDTVMEANGVSRESAESQFAVFNRVTKAECSLPVISAIGNHDSWGWEKDLGPIGKQDREPGRGKEMVQQALELPGRYYRIDRNGWSVIVLDSIFGAYTGRLDTEQTDWLKQELARISPDTPVAVLTHIPIITACGYFDGERFAEKCGERGWTVPGSWMHEDARALKDLFRQHPNVKLALSGHMHQLDRIDFQGVSYICSGAVSANWWKGKYYDCDYGYSTLDLYDDGSFDHTYNTYGWSGKS